MTNNLTSLFSRCLNATYAHVENDGDYAIQRSGNTLYLLFQCTDSKIDWKNNFDFPAKPYKDMGITWRCHRGFLRVWKSIEPYIEKAVEDKTVNKIFVVGYSHGAAIATLAHEYVWFHRPDLREDGLEGFGFGCPRCYFGWYMKKELKERWEHFHPIRNQNDIVTHVPPVLFGFRHVNKVTKLPNTGVESNYNKIKCVNAHYPYNYLYNIKVWDEIQEKIGGDGYHEAE